MKFEFDHDIEFDRLLGGSWSFSCVVWVLQSLKENEMIKLKILEGVLHEKKLAYASWRFVIGSCSVNIQIYSHESVVSEQYNLACMHGGEIIFVMDKFTET